MITSSKRASTVPPGRAAFTLAEMMVTLAVLAVVLGSIIPTFVFFTKSVTSLGNYSIMSGESRGALEIFGRDLHAAENLTRASSSELTVVLPDDLGGATVNYKFSATDKNFIRKKTDSSGNLLSEDILFEDVDSFKFVYYNRRDVKLDDDAPNLAETKSVQINAKLLKKVITTNTTDYIISARFLMRNFN